MKRGNQFTDVARAAGSGGPQATPAALDGVVEDDRGAGRNGAAALRQAVRETEPPGAFDAHAIRDLYKAAPTDPKGLRRTIRRSELRQIVPLSDSTIYELERRGEFPQRFYLTARCVVWDLAEVMAWLHGRRHAGSNGVKKAPIPDYRRRRRPRLAIQDADRYRAVALPLERSVVSVPLEPTMARRDFARVVPT
jgi:prophage regulatory protein